MKKSLIIIFVAVPSALCNSENCLNFVQFNLSSALTLPEENSVKENTLSAKSGLKLSFKNADFRAFASLSETSFSSLQNYRSLKDVELKNKSAGAGLFLFRDFLPVSLKAGHLTFSKSLAKLMNPSPSTTVNPLTKSFAFSTGLSPSLPGLSSSNKKLSFSLETKISPAFFNLQTYTGCFTNEDKEGGFYFSEKYRISRSLFIQGAVTAGNFYIENNSKILKKNNADFSPDYFYSALGEVCFHSPLLKLNLYSGIQESPYKTNPLWIKSDIRSSFKNLLLNASYFSILTSRTSPKAVPLIGASSAVCRTIEQAVINPQIMILFHDRSSSSLRLGFSALENAKVTATNRPILLNTAKYRAGAEYENKFFDIRLDWTHANILLKGNPPTKASKPEEYISYSLTSSYSGTFAKTAFSASYTLTVPKTKKDSEKEKYSADIKFSFPALRMTAKTGFDFTVKGKEIKKGEIKAALGYEARKKKLRLVTRAEVKMKV